MDLRHLHTLVVLAEELHYGRAARRLHVAQPAVTRTIQDLEEHVGALLFRRDKRSVELTPAGERLVQRARAILEAIDSAALECRSIGEGKTGRLRIAANDLVCVGFLPEALRQFRARFPDVEVELSRVASLDQIAALREGRVDLVFEGIPMADDGIAVERVTNERLCAILPEGHELARDPPVRAERLYREPFVILRRSREPELYRTFFAIASRVGVPNPRVVEADDASTMLTLVAAGLAVCQLPESATRFLFRGVVAMPMEPTLVVGMHAMRRKGLPSPLVSAFLDEVRITQRPRGRELPG
jgi:DNA-binding transcriptional LysR family regulator